MTFDADFLARLKQRDPATCTWFIFTFTPILEAMLRYKLRDHAAIEDVRSETFCRVLELVDGDRVREPERFGGFVRGVCSRVTQEAIRRIGPGAPLPENFEPPDRQPIIDQLLEHKELLVLVRNGLRKLSPEDRKLIAESYLQGRAREQMAWDRNISVVGLNVRICRALKRLRMMMLARI
jgi:DNA-directed RNA polymerase specialized sigma24 family protein